MLMQSAQRWGGGIDAAGEYHIGPYVLIFRHELTAAAFMCPGVDFDSTVWGICICGFA